MELDAITGCSARGAVAMAGPVPLPQRAMLVGSTAIDVDVRCAGG